MGFLYLLLVLPIIMVMKIVFITNPSSTSVCIPFTYYYYFAFKEILCSKATTMALTDEIVISGQENSRQYNSHNWEMRGYVAIAFFTRLPICLPPLLPLPPLPPSPSPHWPSTIALHISPHVKSVELMLFINLPTSFRKRTPSQSRSKSLQINAMCAG